MVLQLFNFSEIPKFLEAFKDPVWMGCGDYPEILAAAEEAYEEVQRVQQLLPPTLGDQMRRMSATYDKKLEAEGRGEVYTGHKIGLEHENLTIVPSALAVLIDKLRKVAREVFIDGLNNYRITGYKDLSGYEKREYRQEVEQYLNDPGVLTFANPFDVGDLHDVAQKGKKEKSGERPKESPEREYYSKLNEAIKKAAGNIAIIIKTEDLLDHLRKLEGDPDLYRLRLDLAREAQNFVIENVVEYQELLVSGREPTR